jgi:hypothetical protein
MTLRDLMLTLIITSPTVSSSFFLAKFQFLILFLVVDSMHNAFDDGNWALVPEKSVREHILSTLQQAKAVMASISRTVLVSQSSWPPFEKVCCICTLCFIVTPFDSL